MAFGALLSSTSANNASPGTSIATSTGITVAVGDLVVVHVGARSVNLITGGTCSDTQGNTWTQLAYGTNGVQQRIVTYYSVITKAGTSNFTVSWTNSSTGDAAIVVGRYEGPFASSPLDQNPTANEATSATQVSGTTGTLSQADELAIGYFCAANGTTYTQSGSWAIDVSDRTGTGANTASAGLVRQVVSATTALQAAVTGAASVPYAGGIATFKKSTGAINVSVTGVSGTGSTGDESVTGKSNYTSTGVAGTSAVGTATFAVTVSASVTGVEGTSAVGDESVVGTGNTTQTGVSGTTAVGDTTVEGKANVTQTGVEGTSALGTSTTQAKANTTQTGVEGTCALGDVSVSAACVFTASGVSATSALGSVSIIIPTSASVTGVYGTTYLSGALVWGLIPSSNTPNWSTLNPSNTPNWTPISSSNTPNWAPITATNTPNWTEPSTSNTPNWQPIPH